jgi:hypothetical protein
MHQQCKIKQYLHYCFLIIQQLGHLPSMVFKKGVDKMVKYFNKWNLKHNFNRVKLMVFKKQESQKTGKVGIYMVKDWR